MNDSLCAAATSDSGVSSCQDSIHTGNSDPGSETAAVTGRAVSAMSSALTLFKAVSPGLVICQRYVCGQQQTIRPRTYTLQSGEAQAGKRACVAALNTRGQGLGAAF